MPRLTYQSAKQQIVHNERAAVHGHMNQKRKGIQLAKSTPEHTPTEHDDAYITMINTTSISYTDQTRKFPIQSSHGSN